MGPPWVRGEPICFQAELTSQNLNSRAGGCVAEKTLPESSWEATAVMVRPASRHPGLSGIRETNREPVRNAGPVPRHTFIGELWRNSDSGVHSRTVVRQNSTDRVCLPRFDRRCSFAAPSQFGLGVMAVGVPLCAGNVAGAPSAQEDESVTSTLPVVPVKSILRNRESRQAGPGSERSRSNSGTTEGAARPSRNGIKTRSRSRSRSKRKSKSIAKSPSAGSSDHDKMANEANRKNVDKLMATQWLCPMASFACPPKRTQFTHPGWEGLQDLCGSDEPGAANGPQLGWLTCLFAPKTQNEANRESVNKMMLAKRLRPMTSILGPPNEANRQAQG